MSGNGLCIVVNLAPSINLLPRLCGGPATGLVVLSKVWVSSLLYNSIIPDEVVGRVDVATIATHVVKIPVAIRIVWEKIHCGVVVLSTVNEHLV